MYPGKALLLFPAMTAWSLFLLRYHLHTVQMATQIPYEPPRNPSLVMLLFLLFTNKLDMIHNRVSIVRAKRIVGFSPRRTLISDVMPRSEGRQHFCRAQHSPPGTQLCMARTNEGESQTEGRCRCGGLFIDYKGEEAPCQHHSK